LAGNRAAIGARYDRTGAYLLGNGAKRFQPHDSLVARYQSARWNAPASFEWVDLSFEPIGSDAVAVAGRFLWGTANAPHPLEASYSALLRRQDGVLRIRLEDESVNPSTIPPAPAADSSGKK
jgi:hypothetical protein